MHNFFFVNQRKFINQGLHLQYFKNKTDPVWYNMHSRIPRAQDFLGRSGGFYDPYGRHNNINPVIAIPTADNSNKEFDQICDETAYKIKEIILNTNRKILLSWSGGIDSTCVLVALLKADIPKERFLILLTKESIEENKFFFDQFIANQLSCADTLEFCTKNSDYQSYYHISGEFGDQLFGSKLMSDFHEHNNLNRYTRWDSVAHIIKEYLFGDHIIGSFFIHQFTNSYKTLNLNIETTSDFFWWLNFNFKWLDVYVRRCFEFDVFGQIRIKNNDVLKIYLENSLPFFNDVEFQKWSIRQIGNTQIRNENKEISKKYIFNFDKNADYYQYKRKENSSPKILKYTQNDIPVYIENNLNVVF